jgi:hypothetical protein
MGVTTAVAGRLKDTSLRVTLQPLFEYSATELSRLLVRLPKSERSQVKFLVTKTLEELEHEQWVESADDTTLISRCLTLRRKPIGEFSIEDLRVMIGQNIGLRYLIPLALERLEKRPFVGGDFYRGDLLGVVLAADRVFWLQSPTELAKAQDLAAKALTRLRKLRTTDDIRRHLSDLAKDFLALPRPAA